MWRAANRKPQFRLISIHSHQRFVFHLPFHKTFSLFALCRHIYNERIAYLLPAHSLFCAFDSVVMNRCDLRCLIKQIEKNKYSLAHISFPLPRTVVILHTLCCVSESATTTTTTTLTTTTMTTMTKSVMPCHFPSISRHSYLYKNYIECCQLHVILQSHFVCIYSFVVEHTE